MAHILYAVFLFGLGYGAGRVHSWLSLRSKVKADAAAVVAEAKKL